MMKNRISTVFADSRSSPTLVLLIRITQDEVIWVPGPLTPGTRLLFRFLWGSRSLNVGADVLFHFSVLTLVSLSVFVYLQLLISLRATMIAMMTIRITRMIRR